MTNVRVLRYEVGMKRLILFTVFLANVMLMTQLQEDSLTFNYSVALNLVRQVHADLLLIPEETDCGDLLNEGISLCLMKRIFKGTDSQVSTDVDTMTCQFNANVDISLWSYLSTSNLKIRNRLTNVSWFCELEPNLVCDGTSHCSTDECHCAAQTNSSGFYFYCFDGSGCLSSDKVCDDKQQCQDGSDECFCDGVVQLSCPLSENKICLSPQRYWEWEWEFAKFNCTVEVEAPNHESYNNTFFLNPINTCLHALNSGNLDGIHDELLSDLLKTNISTICENYCSNETGFIEGNWVSYCDRIVPGAFTHLNYMLDFVFICAKDSLQYFQSFHISTLCDGRRDCDNGADELGCPDRFYCSNQTGTWITEDKVCDHVKDCANGVDECETCDFGNLSSSKFLIHSKVILVVATVMGLAIVLLNLYQGRQCYLGSPSSKKGDIDRMMRLQIFVYDGLMGVYLCCVVAAAVVLRMKGDYCIIERKWRGSGYCSALGVLFSFSSHGSLILVACVSVVRCFTCIARVGTNVRKSSVVVVCAVIFLVNVTHSLFPLLPVGFVREVFRTEIFFSNIEENPFFSRSSVNISHVNLMYRNKYQGEADIYTALTGLRNVTSKPEIFDTMEISYYGNTGLCVHNIFKVKDSYDMYKLGYCVVLVVLLSIVVVTYSRIVWEDRRIKAHLAAAAASAETQGNPNEDDGSNALTLKVALMIGTQLVGWIPQIFATAYFQYMSSTPVPPLVFEVFALVVIPVNSFLNPVFNSELYRNVVGCGWWRWYVSKVTGKSLDREEVQTAG